MKSELRTVSRALWAASGCSEALVLTRMAAAAIVITAAAIGIVLMGERSTSAIGW
jgi:hypothetical protein